MRNPLHSARGRTIIGLSLAVLFVPVLLGIAACFDTPIGDPEQGWVDPRVTGAWMAAEADEAGLGDITLWVLEPYDKRTWLLTWVPIVKAEPPEAEGEEAEEGQEAEEQEGESDSPPPRLTAEQVDSVVAALEAEEMKCDELLVFKAWLTSIGRSRYLVLEPKHLLSSELGFDPELWLIYRLVLRDGAMELSLVDLPEDVNTRGEAESILASRPGDPELFTQPAFMARVPREHYDSLADAMTNATLSSEF